jgi:hypothetical protein
VKPKTSGLAVASLVCGLLGCLGVTAIVGLVLGIIGLRQINRSEGRLGGRGLAIAGIVISALMLLVVLVALGMTAALWPALSRLQENAQATVSANNVRMLCQAAMVYSMEHNDRLPLPDAYPDLLEQGGYVDLVPKGSGDATAFEDPGSPGMGRAYAMNANLTGLRVGHVREPWQTVLFFECRFGAPPAGGPELLPEEPRYPGGYVIGFVDGHTDAVEPEAVGTLVWDPTE